MGNDRFLCPHCGIEMNRSSRAKHLRVKHPESEPSGTSTKQPPIVCGEEDCEASFWYVSGLRGHLREAHGFTMENVSRTFQSLDEFLLWKEEYEKETLSKFVKVRGAKNGVETYDCHRSGIYESKSTNKRIPRVSRKLNKKCTASLVVRHNENGTKSVTIYKEHYGHERQPGMVPLAESEKRKIAGKLVMGVDAERIVGDARDSLPATGSLERVHLINRQDINNIKHKYRIDEKSKRHEEDPISVKVLVEEAAGQVDNPYLFYKGPGEEIPPDCDGLRKSDMLLVIQRNIQARLMTLLGSGSKICMDSTHKTNAYDYYLTTLLVVDELGEGEYYRNHYNTLSYLIHFDALSYKCLTVIFFSFQR